MSKNYREFAQEVMLQVLRILSSQRETLRKQGDLSGEEILENDVIPKYERLYEAFRDPEMPEQPQENENIKKALQDIMNAYTLTQEFVEEQLKKRKELGQDSGAQVVENLFRYELKELENQKAHLLEKAHEILDREATLEHELRESIQEVDQMDAMEKLVPVRAEYSKVSDRVMEVQSRIDMVENRLQKRWPYEIYGTVPKEEMMEIYKKLW